MKKILSLGVISICIMIMLAACNRLGVAGIGDTGLNTPISKTNIETMAWYLSKETDYKIALPEVPEYLKGYAVKVPTSYTEILDGVDYKIEFFQEYYPLGSLIQARITITNNTTETIDYISEYYNTGYFIREDNEKNAFIALGVNQIADYYNAAVDHKVLPAGETSVIEKVFIADPDFIKPDMTYKFIFSLCNVIGPLLNAVTEIKTNNDSSKNIQSKPYYWIFEFPVEVVIK